MTSNIRSIMKTLPHYAKGEVIKGFGRGSKELGIPTANFPEEVVEELPEDIKTGIYFGFASVEKDQVHKMVMSIGWNPFYGNRKKSMETHILHKFDKDFYGEILKVIIVGYIRPEQDYKSLDALIEAINTDISTAETRLNEEVDLAKYKNDEFFSAEN